LTDPTPPLAPSVPPAPEFGLPDPGVSSLELEHPLDSDSPIRKLTNLKLFEAMDDTDAALRAHYWHPWCLQPGARANPVRRTGFGATDNFSLSVCRSGGNLVRS
jgi:hypothetical protein